jgi:signal transduction histidine kinase
MQPIVENPSVDLLVTAVQELSLARDLETVMRIVRTAARKLTGADGATFVLRDGDLCFYADEDAISPLWKGSRFPLHTCISGWAMVNRQAVVIEDIYNDPRVPVDAYRPTFVKSLAMVPIRTQDPIGAIGNYWATRHIPDPAEMKLLQSLADITAVTLENIELYRSLEARVQERTSQLEAANKELEAFSYSVSHDLRAPLRSIDGYLHILLENHLDGMSETGKGFAQRVMTNAKHMNQLIDDMLAFFRMGQKPLFKTTVPVHNLVRAVCKAAQEAEDPTRNIDFTIQPLPSIQADTALLQQVWVNLISNAVKYTRRQERALIEIGFYEEAGEIIYYIKDNGVGFNMDYAHKLFGVFQRLHSPREFEGTGIGLSIVQRIITKHGGSVRAQAEEGNGATFYIALPKT